MKSFLNISLNLNLSVKREKKFLKLHLTTLRKFATFHLLQNTLSTNFKNSLKSAKERFYPITLKNKFKSKEPQIQPSFPQITVLGSKFVIYQSNLVLILSQTNAMQNKERIKVNGQNS